MKQMITSITLLTLVASMIIGSIPNYVFADTQSDSLIRIATQARDQLKIQLSKVDASKEIQLKFELGSTEIEALIKAVNQEEVSVAREHFLTAMKIFTEIIQQISETAPASEAALSTSQPTTLASSTSHELNRLEKYILQLKSISEKNTFEVDFSHANKLIDRAKNDLREGNSDSAYSVIKEIKLSIIELNKTLREKTSQYSTDRAKTLAEKHLEDLDRLIGQAEEMGVSNGTLENLYQARDKLNSVYDASDVQQIIDELKRIIKIKHQFEDTKKQRVQVRVNQLESKYDRLSSFANEIPELNKAKEMLSVLTDLVSEEKLDEAIRNIKPLNNLLYEIENSISYEEAEVTVAEQKTSTIADSKTERIKIKIQRLDNLLNQLSEKVEENAAAKRWLNNAFSLLEDARNQLDDSPNDALEIIMNIEKIIKRVQNII